MCKHDVVNIQHVHCGLVGPERGTRKVGTCVNRLPIMGIPTCHVLPSPQLHVGWAATLATTACAQV